MSASTEKASRKELRRAIGDQGLADIAILAASLRQHESRLQTHDVLLSDTHTLIADHATELGQRLTDIREYDRHLNRHQDFIDRGFWQRLRWIVTGR